MHISMAYETMELDPTVFKPIPFNKFINLHILSTQKKTKNGTTYWENLLGGVLEPFEFQINPTDNTPIVKTNELKIASPHQQIECHDTILLRGTGEVLIKCQILCH